MLSIFFNYIAYKYGVKPAVGFDDKFWHIVALIISITVTIFLILFFIKQLTSHSTYTPLELNSYINKNKIKEYNIALKEEQELKLKKKQNTKNKTFVIKNSLISKINKKKSNTPIINKQKKQNTKNKTFVIKNSLISKINKKKSNTPIINKQKKSNTPIINKQNEDLKKESLLSKTTQIFNNYNLIDEDEDDDWDFDK